MSAFPSTRLVVSDFLLLIHADSILHFENRMLVKGTLLVRKTKCNHYRIEPLFSDSDVYVGLHHTYSNRFCNESHGLFYIHFFYPCSNIFRVRFYYMKHSVWKCWLYILMIWHVKMDTAAALTKRMRCLAVIAFVIISSTGNVLRVAREYVLSFLVAFAVEYTVVFVNKMLHNQ